MKGCLMKKILVIVPEGSDEMEVAPLIEIPGWTKVVEGVERVNVKVAGWDDKVYLFHGLTIVPDMKIHDVDVDEYDAICIPGGWHGTRYFEQIQGDLLQHILTEAHTKGKIVATMCNGVLALGESGLLKGRSVTSFTGECCETCRMTEKSLEKYGAKVQEKAIVKDGNIISNIGPAVGDEDALQLLELLIGKEAVKKIADMMMYTTVKPDELKYTFPTAERKIWSKQ